MSTLIEQMRAKAKESNTLKKMEKEGDSKAVKDKNAIMERIKFVTEKYYDDILEGIQKAAGNGYYKYFINVDPTDFVIEDIDYEANKLKRRWLSMLLAENSEILPKDKPSLNGFKFSVWNNAKNTIVFEWTTNV